MQFTRAGIAYSSHVRGGTHTAPEVGDDWLASIRGASALLLSDVRASLGFPSPNPRCVPDAPLVHLQLPLCARGSVVIPDGAWTYLVYDCPYKTWAL
jgi:hypothetical protein